METIKLQRQFLRELPTVFVFVTNVICKVLYDVLFVIVECPLENAFTVITKQQDVPFEVLIIIFVERYMALADRFPIIEH